jgi:hypothetical protein
VDDPTPDKDSDIERRALLDKPLPFDDRVHNVIDRLTLGFGEESDMSEVDAQQWHIAVSGALRAAQNRAVSSEHDDEFGSVGRSFVSRDDGDAF